MYCFNSINFQYMYSNIDISFVLFNIFSKFLLYLECYLISHKSHQKVGKYIKQNNRYIYNTKMSDMSHYVPDCTVESEYKGLRLEQYYTINIFPQEHVYVFVHEQKNRTKPFSRKLLTLFLYSNTHFQKSFLVIHSVKTYKL